MSETPVTATELSDSQRAWTPWDAIEAYGQWPTAAKVELAAGAVDFTSDVGGWDWRSVALAARTFPGWHITLHDPGWLSARPSSSRVVESERGDVMIDGQGASTADGDAGGSQFQARMVTAGERWVAWCANNGVNPLSANVSDLARAAQQLRADAAPELDVQDLLDQVGFMTGMWRTREWMCLRRAL